MHPVNHKKKKKKILLKSVNIGSAMKWSNLGVNK